MDGQRRRFQGLPNTFGGGPEEDFVVDEGLRTGRMNDSNTGYESVLGALVIARPDGISRRLYT